MGKYIIIVLLIIILAPGINAFSFTSSSQSDFNEGTFDNTTASVDGGNNLSLAEKSIGIFYKNGTYLSKVFNVSERVRWKNITWVESRNDNQYVVFSVRFSEDGNNWGNWTVIGSGMQLQDSKYIQYKINLSTSEIHSSPKIESVSIFYDVFSPVIALNEPIDGYTVSGRTITFNCSASDNYTLENITFWWNYSGTLIPNGTINVSGNYSKDVSFQRIVSNEGDYVWYCSSENNLSNIGVSEQRHFTVNFTTPITINYDIPSTIIEGQSVTINISANSIFPIDDVWINITMPNGTIVKKEVLSGQVSYTPPIPGQYYATIYVNDTNENNANKTASFSVSNIFDMTFDVFYIGDFIPLDVKMFFPGTNTLAYSFTPASDTFKTGVLGGTYDMELRAFNRSLGIFFKKINISENKPVRLNLDKVNSPPAGFSETYAVQTRGDFPDFESAVITIYYNGSENIMNESYLSLFRCSSWDFYNKTCDSSWEKITSTINKKYDFINSSELSSFSAFSIKQDPFCGDNHCNLTAGETDVNCPVDCKCPTGEKRACGTTDVGECKYGTQTCINGAWEECVGSVEPRKEVCNARDDNCDGIIDNVDGKSSIEDTRCRCYSGGFPITEECNGIDDDCDGQIDENLQRECGTDVGICDFGISTCVNGRWGECLNSITSKGIDICNNGLDDNCNGEIDENCPQCTNNIMDGDETGIDCGGSCPNSCPEFPWTILIITGIAIFAVLIVILIIRKGRGKNDSWKDLEERYRYQPPNNYQ